MLVKRRFAHVGPATKMASKWPAKTSFLATPGPSNRPKCAKGAHLKTHQKNTFKKTPQSSKTVRKRAKIQTKNKPFLALFLDPKRDGSQTGPGPQKTSKSDPRTCFFRSFWEAFRCPGHPSSAYFACPWWPKRATVSYRFSYDKSSKR